MPKVPKFALSPAQKMQGGGVTRQSVSAFFVNAYKERKLGMETTILIPPIISPQDQKQLDADFEHVMESDEREAKPHAAEEAPEADQHRAEARGFTADAYTADSVPPASGSSQRPPEVASASSVKQVGERHRSQKWRGAHVV